MKLLLVSMLFVGLAAAQVQESFLVRHKRVSSDCSYQKPCESNKAVENPIQFLIFAFIL